MEDRKTGEAYHRQHGPRLNDYALLIFFLYQSGRHLTSICILCITRSWFSCREYPKNLYTYHK